MSQAQAWLVTVTFINTCHCFPLNGGPGCCYFLVLVSKDDKLFYNLSLDLIQNTDLMCFR